MSLLDDAFEPFAIMDKTTQDDGYGGVVTTWAEGAEISAAAVLDDSIQAMVAMQQDVKGVYTITTRKNVVLQFHDVVKRLSDSKIFRVVTDGDDKKTPPTATLDMRQVRAEEWTP